MKCVGCDGEIPWDGTGLFSYTCPCGATVFYDENSFAPPASLVIALKEGKELAHIDYYVGISGHTSAIKERLVVELRMNGAIWSWECHECRDSFLERRRALIKDKLSFIDLHPDLKKRL